MHSHGNKSKRPVYGFYFIMQKDTFLKILIYARVLITLWSCLKFSNTIRTTFCLNLNIVILKKVVSTFLSPLQRFR